MARDRVGPANPGGLGMVPAMAAALTCPYCGHAIVSDDEATAAAENCPSCGGELLLAYRYQLIRARGEVAGGVLYEATDPGFAHSVAVLFVADPNDKAAVERFVAGHRLFANQRTRGLIGIHEVSRATHKRPYVVMDWLAGGTLDRVVGKSGALDPTHVWTMTSSLLIGLERAHRALPALVHGQVHPGKIGFRKPSAEAGPAVLFGFEWARLVSEQDSSLADSFSADAGVEVERASSLDLRGLARSIVYAATGRWIEDGTRDRQRQQAAGMMPGPMAPFIDRLLAAGTPDGYKSTSVARDEFELIRAGGERRHRGFGGASHPVSSAPPPVDLLDGSDDHDDDDDSPPASASRATPPSTAARFEEMRRQQVQLAAVQAAAASSQPSKGNGKVLIIGLIIVIGTYTVGWNIANSESDEPVAVSRGPSTPPPVVEPIPDWAAPMPAVSEPVPVPEPVPIVPAFAARKWSAKVESTIKGGPVKAGTKCELWVTAAPNDSSFNCKWAVDCKERGGWTRYFGNDGSGLGTCEFEADKLMYFADLGDDDGDGLMVFDARGKHPWLLFGDRHADPARAVLMRLDGKPKLAEQPNQAEPRALQRREFENIGDDEYRAAGLELERLAASVELDLDLVEDDSNDEDLPQTLDIFALQTTIDSIQTDLLDCKAPEGTEVEVGLTIEGSTGIASKVDLTNTVDRDHETCLRTVLGATWFGRFSDETLTVNWTIAY